MIEAIAQYNFIAGKMMNSEVIERSKRLAECADHCERLAEYGLTMQDVIKYGQWAADIRATIIPPPGESSD